MESADNSSSPQQTESSQSHEEITTAKDKSKNHPRRFTDDQIKSLESIFKQETKLDPRKKLQVARDLGLQPRQVAIWFQNKRARWKSKQIEHEYNVLRSNYNTLSTRFEHLKCEKLSLQMQLQELSDLVKNLENVDSGENPNSSAEEMDQKMIADYLEEREELMKWVEEEEEREVISQTWRNLSTVGLLDQSSNWWES